MKKFLAIDGNSLLNRAFYGIRNLTNSKGMPTNAIYGLLNIVVKILKEVEPDYIVAAFDMRGKTFRHEKSADYKANRHGMPEDLAVQFPFAKKMLELLGMNVVEVAGFEGDDILGTVSRLCRENNIDCVICSGDRDCLQLVDNKTTVRLATNKESINYDYNKVVKEYGVTPKELIEIKALMGDSSDNIKGVAGIGQKTAFTLIQKYHNIDTIFKLKEEELDATPRQRKLLFAEGAKEDATLSRELGLINCYAPIQTNVEIYLKKEIKEEELIDFFSEFEFKNVREKIEFLLSADIEVKEIERSTTILDEDIEKVDKLLKKEEKIVFILDETLIIFAANNVFEFSKDVNNVFKRLIANNNKEKWTYNLKGLEHYAIKEGINLKNVTATGEISGYLLDVLAKGYSLEELRDKYAREKPLPEAFLTIMEKMEREIEDQKMTLLEKEIEVPLVKVLAEMETVGFEIDDVGLRKWGDEFGKRIEVIEREVEEMAGEKFNLNSPKEVGAILFDKLCLPPQKKTKTGYSTDAEVLEKLIKYHPIAKAILEYRTLSKLKATYVLGLLKAAGKDKRVRSIFKQTETRTGRLSSAEPNMQNIPVRDEFSGTFRKFFVAPKGYVLIDADYSQIELRILAQLSQDEKMLKAFKNGEDIHLLTASQVFGFDERLVPPELRRRAKIINFSIIYGAGAYSLSQDIGVSPKEAKLYIEKYFEMYSGVKDYMDNIVKEAKELGYVKTMFNRKREIPEFKSPNYNIREFAARAAKNTIVQGTAADVIKIAMVKVNRRLKSENLNARLILQVHDELLIEASERDAKASAKVLKEEMEGAVKLSVPLLVDVSTGKSWYDAKM